MIRTLWLLIVLLSVPAGAALAADDTDLSGLYLCEGVNPEGHTYEAVVQIVKYHATYQVQWTFKGDGATAYGVGIRSGEVLAVSYVANSVGLVAYRIEDGRLVGQWTVPGADGEVFTETLTRTKEIQLEHPAVPDRPAPQPTPIDVPIRVALLE